MDDYQHLCPVCKSNGITTFLQLRQINLTTAVYLCKDIRCSYPQGHTWIYVDRKFSDDNDSDSDSSDSSVSDDIERLRTGNHQTAFTDINVEHSYKDSPRDLKIVRDEESGNPELGILEEASKKDMIIVNSLTDIENIIVDDPDKIFPAKNATDPIVLASGVSDSEIVDVNVAEDTNESSNIEYKLVANSESNEYKFNIQFIDQKQNNQEDIQKNVSEPQYNLKKAFVCNAVDLKTEKMGKVNNKNIIRVETCKEINKITVPDLSKVIIVSNKEALSKIKTNDNLYLPNTDHIYCLPNNNLDVVEHTRIDSTETHINKISVKKNLYDLEKNNIKLSERPKNVQNTVNTDEDIEIIYENVNTDKDIEIIYENVPRLQVANFVDIPQNKEKDVMKKERPFSEVEKVFFISKQIQNTVKTNKTTKIVDNKGSNLQMVNSEDILKKMNTVKNKLPGLEENKPKLSKHPEKDQNKVEANDPVEDFDEWSFIDSSSAETSAKKIDIKTPEKLKKDHFNLILPNVKDVQDMTINIQKPKFDVIFKSKLKLQSKKDKKHTFKFSESMIDEALKITKKVETVAKPVEKRSLVKSICKRSNIVGVRNKASRFEGFRYKSRIREDDRSTEAASTRELRSRIKRPSVTEQTLTKKLSEENVDSDSSDNPIVDVDLNVNDASSKSAINDTTNLGLGDLTINELFDSIDGVGPVNVPNNAVDIAEVDDWLTSLCQ